MRVELEPLFYFVLRTGTSLEYFELNLFSGFVQEEICEIFRDKFTQVVDTPFIILGNGLSENGDERVFHFQLGKFGLINLSIEVEFLVSHTFNLAFKHVMQKRICLPSKLVYNLCILADNVFPEFLKFTCHFLCNQF